MTERKQADKEANEVLQLEAITAEIGDITIPVKDDDAANMADTLPADLFPDIGGTDLGGAAPAREMKEYSEVDRINSRVLAGCSPKTRPMYVEGIFCGVLAALFMAPIVLRTGFLQYQPWFSYFSIMLAGGAAIWSLSGLNVETKVEGKRMCLASAGFCAAVALVAFLFRAYP